MTNSAKKIIRASVPRRLRNWVRDPSASAGWAWDAVKFAAGMRTTVEMRPGWSLVCHPAAYRCAYFAQDADPEQVAEFDGFIRSARREMVFFDIGAHFGLFSLAALHYGGEGARAVAVDPSPTATHFIELQARLNRTADRLRVVRASAGDHDGWQEMVSVGVQASGYYVAPTKDHSAAELTRTPAVTLDQLVREHGLSPTHVKIDVEGYEAAVIRGGRRLLSGASAPLLFIELHNEIIRHGDGDPRESLELLRGFGYEILTVDGLPTTEEEILGQPLVRVLARRGGAPRHAAPAPAGAHTPAAR